MVTALCSKCCFTRHDKTVDQFLSLRYHTLLLCPIYTLLWMLGFWNTPSTICFTTNSIYTLWVLCFHLEHCLAMLLHQSLIAKGQQDQRTISTDNLFHKGSDPCNLNNQSPISKLSCLANLRVPLSVNFTPIVHLLRSKSVDDFAAFPCDLTHFHTE